MGCGLSATNTSSYNDTRGNDDTTRHIGTDDTHNTIYDNHDITHNTTTNDTRHDDRTVEPDHHLDVNDTTHNDTTHDVVPPDNARDVTEDLGHRRTDANADDDSGLIYDTYDFRTQTSPTYQDSKPEYRGRPWVDNEFPPHTAIQEFSQKKLDWKRPQEVAAEPVLFSEGTTRFDIGQGAAGTCWFLSMLANLSEHSQLMKKVVSERDYDQQEGYFHCKFWKFGIWEDVYIDDYLPVIYNTQIWGAQSSTDRNEMWVSLLEKAFAKLHGSYNSIYGGQSSDAYLALTGGIAERVDFDDRDVVPDELFQRVRNALRTAAMVSCTVPEKFDGQFGLVGGHAYSLTGAALVERYDGGTERLVRVRNPWGNTEWNGKWSDESPEWQNIAPDAIERVNIDDGEFWINLEDFLTYFSQTTICSLTPDFDMDGCSDSLNHVLRIYGQWLGDSAAGFRERLHNPKFIFTVPDDGMTEEGHVPLVVQLIQRTKHRKVDKASIRIDLFKVLGGKTHGRPTYVLEMLGTDTNVYTPSVQCASRYRVEPGQYVAITSTIDSGTEKEFLIRIFAPCRLLECSEINNDAILMSCDAETSMDIDGSIIKITTFETFFGAWIGENAGGQISKRDTHDKNPQFTFTVPERGMRIPVIFHLMQPQEQPQYPLGLRVFPLRRSAPVDIQYLYEHYDNCPDPVEGATFMQTWNLDVKYALAAGDYVVILHLDDPYTEKQFCLHIRSSAHLHIRGYQTGV